MANRFWVGGTGTWDAATTTNWASVSGGAGGASVPTSADDVFIDGNSGVGTVTIAASTSAHCLSINFTGYTGTFAWGNSSSTLSVDGTSGGNCTFSSTMTVSTAVLGTINLAPSGPINATYTLTSAGKTLPHITINPSQSITYQLADALTMASGTTLQHSQGGLTTNNFSVAGTNYASAVSTTRALTLGSSSVSMVGNWSITTTNMTQSPGTSTVTLNSLTSSGGSATFFDVVVTSGGSLASMSSAGMTCRNLTVQTAANKTATFPIRAGATVTCSGTFTVNANSSVNRLLVQSNTVGTAVTITAAAVVISNVVDFADITGAGAATWTVAGTGATLLGDAGGNSGITFTPAATQTWQGTAGGNWSDVTKWTSRVPLPQDNVVIASAFVATQTITTDMPRAGADITWTGSTGAPRWTNSVTSTFYGSVTLVSGMTMLSATGDWIFGGRGTHTITSGGVSWGTNILRIIAPGASYTFADAFTLPQALVLTNGSLNTAGFAMSLLTFSSTGTATRALTLGTSTVSLTQTAAANVWSVASTGLTLSAASSTIAFTTASTSLRVFVGANLTYGTLTYTVAASTGGLQITGGNAFGTINVSGGARTLTLTSNTTQVVTNWNVFGLVGAVVTVNTSTGGSAATISKSSGYIASDYVSVQDITGTGGATFYMGSRSTNVSGNTGLSFTNAPQRYWVLGTGTWDAATTTQWAVVSGGTGGIAVPTAAEDVYFDANSGGGTVTVNPTANVKNLVFTGYTGTITASSVNINVSGTTLTLASTMTVGAALLFNIQSGTTTTITSAGKTITQLSSGVSTTTLVLADALSVSGTITLSSGGFTTNNFAVTCGTFTSSNSNVRTLTLGSSSVTVTGASATVMNITSTNLTVTANTSVVTFTGTSPGIVPPTNMQGGSLVLSGGGNVDFYGATMANLTLTGSAVKTGFIRLNSSVTCTGTFTVNGNTATNRYFIRTGNGGGTDSPGTQRTITAAVVVASNADFMDIIGAGAGSWNLSAITGGSGDALGNSGITFTPATTRYGVVAGNWSSTATWSTVSGGAGGASVPLPQDTVILDANGSAGTYTIDMPRIGKDLTCTGFIRTLNVSTGLTMYGSLVFSSAMALTVNGFHWAFGGRGSHTITSAGLAINGGTDFTAPGATYTLADALNNSFGGITLNNGTLNTAGFALTCVTFGSNNTNTRALTLGTSTVTITSTVAGTVWNFTTTTGLTFSGASATYVITNASTSTRNFVGGGLSYGTLTYTVAASPGALALSGANTFGTLNVGSGRTLTLPSSTTTTVTNWNVVGADFDYLYLPGVSVNYASAPDAVALRISGDIDLRCKVALDDWTPAAVTALVGKHNGDTSNQGYYLRVQPTGALALALSNNGISATVVASSVAPVVADGAVLWVRATWRQSDGRVQFFTSPDGAVWTQLGTDQVIVLASIFATTAPVEVGSVNGGGQQLLAGKMYRAQILNGIGGAAVFDADFSTKPVGANSWVGTAGNTITINGTLAQVGDGRVALNSSTAGTAATLSKTTGSVISGYLSIQDITATGGATWYAGATSTNVSGNTGWIFTDMPVDVTRSTSWAVKAAVTQTRSTSWPVRALATASRQTSWNTRAAVSATRSTSWPVRITAAASRSTRWQVTSAVTASRASSWSVRAAVTASRQSTWSVAQAVTKAAATSWAVTSAVTKAIATSWQLTSRVDASRATGWAVTAAVDASAGASWAVRAAVPTATRRTGWSVAQLAARSCATRWALTSRVDNSCATGWSTAQAVRADRATSWSVRTKADASRLTRWRVRHGHGRNITAYAGPPRSGWYAGEPASGWSAQEPKSGWHAREPVE